MTKIIIGKPELKRLFQSPDKHVSFTTEHLNRITSYNVCYTKLLRTISAKWSKIHVHNTITILCVPNAENYGITLITLYIFKIFNKERFIFILRNNFV